MRAWILIGVFLITGCVSTTRYNVCQSKVAELGREVKRLNDRNLELSGENIVLKDNMRKANEGIRNLWGKLEKKDLKKGK